MTYHGPAVIEGPIVINSSRMCVSILCAALFPSAAVAQMRLEGAAVYNVTPAMIDEAAVKAASATAKVRIRAAQLK